MTHKEAECFRALQRWHRVNLRYRFYRAFFPKPAILRYFGQANTLGKIVAILLMIVFSPLLILIWLLGIARAILQFPIIYALTFFTPFGLRAPGERNIKGVHYQFSRHIELPPNLYIKCVDEWVAILYGHEKLPQFSITEYLNTDYISRRKVAFEDESYIEEIIQSQISNAREELSQDLGHY